MVLQNNYVIGIDGGGTKTIAALADLKGRILKIGKSGSSSPRNVGVKEAAGNVVKAVRKVLPKNKSKPRNTTSSAFLKRTQNRRRRLEDDIRGKVLSIFVGLPAIQEEFAPKVGEIKKLISQKIKVKPIIGSDQLVAFRSGTNEKNGIILIAGTGSVSHGWKGNEEHKASGWGWLADEGSAFWIGQKYYQAVLRGLDGRGQKTRRKPFSKIYSADFIKKVSAIAALCDSAANKGNKAARGILTEAGLELALSVKSVIKKLNFSQAKFPLVLVGSVLKSKIVLNTLKKEVKKAAPKVEFIQPKRKPVMGAVKLALEHAAVS